MDYGSKERREKHKASSHALILCSGRVFVDEAALRLLLLSGEALSLPSLFETLRLRPLLHHAIFLHRLLDLLLLALISDYSQLAVLILPDEAGVEDLLDLVVHVADAARLGLHLLHLLLHLLEGAHLGRDISFTLSLPLLLLLQLDLGFSPDGRALHKVGADSMGH